MLVVILISNLYKDVLVRKGGFDTFFSLLSKISYINHGPSFSSHP